MESSLWTFEEGSFTRSWKSLATEKVGQGNEYWHLISAGLTTVNHLSLWTDTDCKQCSIEPFHTTYPICYSFYLASHFPWLSNVQRLILVYYFSSTNCLPFQNCLSILYTPLLSLSHIIFVLFILFLFHLIEFLILFYFIS